MALKSPLMPSPTGGLSSAFSPYTDSPNSPAPLGQAFPNSNRSSGPSDSLAPPPSPYPMQIEPSPVDSNGTEGTEIEEDAQVDDDAGASSNAEGELKSPNIEINSPHSVESERLHKLNTQLPSRARSNSDDAPQSVIHAPSGFRNFDDPQSGDHSPTDRSANTIVSPTTPEAAKSPEDRELMSTSPINADVARYSDLSTPSAQTRQEAGDDWKQRSRRPSSLEDIPEALDADRVDGEQGEGEGDRPDTAELVGDGTMSQAMQALHNAEAGVAALRLALGECWTLCNTLANLSSIHRERTFKFAGKSEVQEQAWRSCWRLCQQLYNSRDEDHASQVLPTLELCRDFCQSLFEARQKGDEEADSVLRVSFELNNHLYNTHNRNLPQAFQERTLDFYITLCHRLMKMRTSLPQAMDALLRACWSLAEMLFSLRQTNGEAKLADEELLGSAIQACWELCDLFREGWTKIRPERGTPRPRQTTFPPKAFSTLSRSDGRSNSSLSNSAYHDAPLLPPETPTTIFDDTTTSTASSPDSVIVPNILVLGPASTGSNSVRGGTHHERWSSNASVLSGYSESTSSQRTSSTTTAGGDDAQLNRLRCLMLKAAMNTGYSRTSGQALPAFVKALPANAFGALPWQIKVLDFYKKLVMSDQSMKNVGTSPSRRLASSEVAKAVKWLGRHEQWAWMRDLYRLVFGFGIEEAERRNGAIHI